MHRTAVSYVSWPYKLFTELSGPSAPAAFREPSYLNLAPERNISVPLHVYPHLVLSFGPLFFVSSPVKLCAAGCFRCATGNFQACSSIKLEYSIPGCGRKCSKWDQWVNSGEVKSAHSYLGLGKTACELYAWEGRLKGIDFINFPQKMIGMTGWCYTRFSLPPRGPEEGFYHAVVEALSNPSCLRHRDTSCGIFGWR